MNVTRGDWFDDGIDPPLLGGDASGLLYPDDVSMFTDEERDQWRAELRAREARRRPPGFTAAWPEEPEQPQRLRIA